MHRSVAGGALQHRRFVRIKKENLNAPVLLRAVVFPGVLAYGKRFAAGDAGLLCVNEGQGFAQRGECFVGKVLAGGRQNQIVFVTIEDRLPQGHGPFFIAAVFYFVKQRLVELRIGRFVRENKIIYGDEIGYRLFGVFIPLIIDRSWITVPVHLFRKVGEDLLIVFDLVLFFGDFRPFAPLVL